MVHKQKLQVAEIKLSYSSKVKASDRLQITGSEEAYKVFYAGWDKGKIGFV